MLVLIYLYQYYDYKKQIYIINNSTVDYIEIKRLKIKRIIVPSFDMEQINKGYIGMENINGNIVLAGHALEQIFLRLYKIKINDNIIICLNEIKYNYIVEDIFLVNKDDLDVYNYIDKLLLVTCDYNKNKRMIIVSKKLT